MAAGKREPGSRFSKQGAVFDYYELTVLIDERMTDEEWQQKLESTSPPQPPKWTGSFLSPFKSTGKKIDFDQIPVFTRGGC